MASRWRRVSGAIKRRKDDNKTNAVATGAAKDGASITQIPLSDASRLQNYYDQRNGRIQVEIAVFGAPGVGRRCLLRHWGHGLYIESKSVDPTDSGIYRILTPQPYGIAIVELTRGEEHLYRLPLIAAVDCYDLVIITYNVGDRRSFDEMGRIYEQSVLQRRTRGRPVWQGVMVIALAHDLAGQLNAVDSHLGRDFARARGFSFRELSTKSGYGCTKEDYSAMVTDLVRQQIAGDDITKLRRYLETSSTGIEINVATLGACGIGKTSFLRCLTRGNFSTDHESNVPDNEVKRLNMLGGSCSLEFKSYGDDLNGIVPYNASLRSNFLAVMYNVGSRQSFLDMQEMYERSVVRRRKSNRPEPWPSTIVIALASDLSGQPDAAGTHSGRLFAQNQGIGFHETSVKTELGCTDADFTSLTTTLLLQHMAKDKTLRLRRYLKSHAKEIRINVLCLGDPDIGKKCFLRTMCTGKYTPGYDPTECEISGSVRILDHVRWVHFEVGPSDLSNVGPKLGHFTYGRYDFVMMAYKVSSAKSFANMRKAYEQSVVLRQKFEPWHGAMVVALGSDLAEQPNSVKSQQGLDYANSKRASFREVSAKQGLGCTQIDLASIAQDFLLQWLEKIG